MSTRAIIAAVALASLCACRDSIPQAPEVTGITPAQTRGDAPTPVTVTGGPFTVRVHANLDTSGEAEPLGTFRVSLISSALRIDLTSVSWVSSTELSAVVPAGVPGGLYTVEVVDPWDRAALLADAFTVAPECLTPDDCADALSCTQDACVAGRCERTLAAGSCLIDGACQPAGISSTQPCLRCDPAVNPGGWTPLAEGDACDDHDLCTQGEACHAQVCGQPVSTVSCGALDNCHEAGSCDPASGTCSTPPKLNGTPCTDGDACTLGESCQNGSCAAPTATVSCPASGCLQAGSCNPATGACERAELSGSCDDGYDCTSGDACQAGSCRGSAVCGDTPPRACLTLSTQGATAPASLTVDPGCSFDLETPSSGLLARFDLDGDGSFDTPFQALAPRSLSLTTPGLYPISVEVQDGAGQLQAATRHVVVASAADTLVVTSRSDEQDPGATPLAPGGTGLSLREAITYVNSTAVARTIRFAAPMTIEARNLPPLTVAGTRLAGGAGVKLDFRLSTSSQPCLTLSANGQQVVGLELTGCAGVTVMFNGSGGLLLDSLLRGGLRDGVVFNDTNNRVGPGVEISGFAELGVDIRKTGNVVTGASIHDNAFGGVLVFNNAGTAQLTGNEIHFNGGTGIEVSQGNASPRLLHNTVHSNQGDGVSIHPNATGVELRNNLLTQNVGFGACGAATTYSAENPNGLSGNTLGAYCANAPDGGSVLADPLYLAPALGDFRLRPGSPAANAGVPLALDVNGASDGGYFGPLPDLGAEESPY